jgi:hypothetical protein
MPPPAPLEFIRRFLIHVLPKGFHRIRHYGLFANGNRTETIARARELLAAATAHKKAETDIHDTGAEAEPNQPCISPRPCSFCGGRMIIIEVFAPGKTPRHRPSPRPPLIRIDTS